jgi:aldehyde dehydrogenase (NAD+)
VHQDAPLALTAKRIAWGKYFNAGQSCVAPDYLIIHQEIKDAFLEKLIRFIRDFYGENPQLSPDYPRVVNRVNTERLQDLMSAGSIVTGGITDPDEKYIAPTVIDGLHPDDPIMQGEVFGPVLPVLTYSTIEEAIDIINRHPNPLAFYLFTKDRAMQKRLLNEISFGTASLNDTTIHFINSNLPFGGVGESGMGKYHGKKSFDTFTNYKSILKKTNLFDFPIRYPPYTKRNANLLKRFLR